MSVCACEGNKGKGWQNNHLNRLKNGKEKDKNYILIEMQNIKPLQTLSHLQKGEQQIRWGWGKKPHVQSIWTTFEEEIATTGKHGAGGGGDGGHDQKKKNNNKYVPYTPTPYRQNTTRRQPYPGCYFSG